MLAQKEIKESERKEKVDFLAKQAESPEATGTTDSDLENNIKLTMVFRPIFSYNDVYISFWSRWLTHLLLVTVYIE